ncbi:hypothetical protein J437_LFUL018696 [Ladona fulva]|uniref:Luciferase n=1 Tax=Ladona fulva TaxID=123851 RepID=A0A8K0KNU4_LADFU|nr:hypothetical protein J437_LFUL018696 [Ladona fulva]
MPDDIGISPKDDIASIFNTSGCTGLPKGAVHTHYSIISLLCHARGLMGHGALFTQMPNFLAGTLLCITHCIWKGYSYLSLSRFTPDTFFDYLEKYKPGSIFLFGFMVNWFSHAPEVNSRDLSYIERITIGGSFLDVASTKALASNFPQAKIIQLFGISEALYIAGTEVAEGEVENIVENSEKAIMVKGIKSVIIDGDYCLTTGKLLPSVEVKIVDVNTGVELGPLEKGEMLVKNHYMMKGYITSDLKERCKSGLDADGWFHSGDLVACDHAGNIYPFDRTAHTFNYCGHQIVPMEIEAVLAQHPAVLSSCVVGIPDPEAKSLTRAYVILRPGEENQGVTADDLIAFVKDKVAPHKQLHGGLKFVTHLPMKRCILLDRAALLKQILNEDIVS